MTRRPLGVALLALLAVVLFALPPLLSTVFARMDQQRPEVRFVREMSQHHAQAVDLATRIRDRSRDQTIRTIALDIMLSQQEQIGQMRGWMTVWGLPWGGPAMTAQHAREMGMATPAELDSLDALPPAEAEVKFLQLMTRHHQGALAMVQPALQPGVRREVRALAQQIAATQGAEIRLMTTLLAQRGARPLPALSAPTSPSTGPGSAAEHEH